MKTYLDCPVLDRRMSSIQQDLETSFYRRAYTLGYQDLYVPSTLSKEDFLRQEIASDSIAMDESYSKSNILLSGSAEQGLLSYFRREGSPQKEEKFISTNQCWRTEDPYEGWLRCREFKKIELFAFVEEDNWKTFWKEQMLFVVKFLEDLDLRFRVVDCTHSDEGYHKHKEDIYVLTKTYGWIETHSVTYFGQEQVKRYDLNTPLHTISSTGLAFPRILIPLWEIENLP